MIQNSSSITTEATESESPKQPGNSYANIDPSSVNSAPVPPAGMCIPTNYVNVTPACVTSFQEVVQGHQTEQRHSLDSGHVAESSKNQSKAEATNGTGEKESKIINDVPGQDHAVNEIQSKNSEEYVETDLVNGGSQGVDVPDIGKMPEYMNVDVPQDHKIDANKKVPAPPVPPRGKITFFFLSRKDL